MRGHVEVPHAEREVDRVEIFERRGEIDQVQRQERDGENGDRAYTARRNNPSFRLPVRYPWRSMLMWV